MGAVLWTGVLGATIAARLHPPFAGEARWIALGGAFWMATHGYLRRGGEAESGLRFVAGLALAAGASQIGWVLLHLDRVPADPRALLDLATGQSVLFAPLGLLAVAPWSRAARERYLAAALGSLPRAFAVARLGCLAAGCCHGVTGIHGTHPTRLYEIVGLLALDAGTRRLPSAWVGPATLVGFGGVRLLTEPVRAVPPLGEPLVAPSCVGARLGRDRSRDGAGCGAASPQACRSSMRRASLTGALQVMLAVWTVLLSGPPLSSRIGAEPATFLVFFVSAALLVATRRPPVARPRGRHALLFGLALALGFASHAPLGGVIGLVGLALGLDPGELSSAGAAGPLLLISVVAVAPVFEELLYRERLLDAIAATRLGGSGATLLTSALFALTHLTAWQVLGSFLVGLVLALLRRASRSVLACIGFHAGLNLCSVRDCAGGALDV